jgi:hypothetical protein
LKGLKALLNIIGIKHQQDHFKDWCSENNPGLVEYFEVDDKSLDYNEERNICSIPELFKEWLEVFCPIDFVLEQIKSKN